MTPLFAHSIYLELPVVLVVVSVVYSATRYDEWADIVSEAWRWGGRMVSFLAGIGVMLYVLSYCIDRNIDLRYVVVPAVVVMAIYYGWRALPTPKK